MGPQYNSTSNSSQSAKMGAPATIATAPLSIPTKSTRFATDVATAAPFDPRCNTIPEATAFSPVNENGCFEFDRLIKEGEILKKSRKTKVSVHSSLRMDAGLQYWLDIILWKHAAYDTTPDMNYRGANSTTIDIQSIPPCPSTTKSIPLCRQRTHCPSTLDTSKRY
jgi:hypothetical protein